MALRSCRATALAGLTLLCGLWWPHDAAALPEDPGKLKLQKLSLQQTVAGMLLSFDLYIPQLSAPAPVVALGHGFARSRLQLEYTGSWSSPVRSG